MMRCTEAADLNTAMLAASIRVRDRDIGAHPVGTVAAVMTDTASKDFHRNLENTHLWPKEVDEFWPKEVDESIGPAKQRHDHAQCLRCAIQETFPKRVSEMPEEASGMKPEEAINWLPTKPQTRSRRQDGGNITVVASPSGVAIPSQKGRRYHATQF